VCSVMFSHAIREREMNVHRDVRHCSGVLSDASRREGREVIVLLLCDAA
jgi:hypothetical protein